MMEYDSGDPLGCLDERLPQPIGMASKRSRNRPRGKFRGIGLCTYVEACGLAPSRIAIRLGVRGGLFESATVRVHPTGHVTVLMGTHNHGQGHETTCAQIVSEKLGIPADNVEIVFGDTDKVQFGLEPMARVRLRWVAPRSSRPPTRSSLKGKKIAAHMFEADEGDILRKRSVRRPSYRPAKPFCDVVGSAYVSGQFPD